MKLFSLDERLMMCASLVRKSARLVDVGSDHAYLPVWLLKNGAVSFAIASDINAQPLESGRATAEKYGAENIEFRLGSGLETVCAEDRITDVVIAGMGGEIIADIIAQSPLTRNSELRLILQPMTRSEILTEFLLTNGFVITEQSCVFSRKKVYTVIAAKYSGEKTELSPTDKFTGRLDLTDETSRLFLQKHIRNLENKAKGGDENAAMLAEKLRELIK